RNANMPKDNIERAIARATAKGAGELSEVIYEGFAPGGVSDMVEAVTDNTNRTTSEVKSLFSKSGASFAQPGVVSYQFEQTGEIIINKHGKSIVDMFMLAAELGANDVEDREEEAGIFTNVSDLSRIKDGLQSAGLETTSAELSRKPNTMMVVDSE